MHPYNYSSYAFPCFALRNISSCTKRTFCFSHIFSGVFSCFACMKTFFDRNHIPFPSPSVASNHSTGCLHLRSPSGPSTHSTASRRHHLRPLLVFGPSIVAVGPVVVRGASTSFYPPKVLLDLFQDVLRHCIMSDSQYYCQNHDT